MKLNKIALTLALTATASTAFAAAPVAHDSQGLYDQVGVKRASEYDVVQDKVAQAAAGLANSALTQNQQLVTQVNTVTAAVGANATAIGQTNAAVAQNTQAVSTLQQQQAAQQTANGNFATKTELATETQARKDGDNILKAKIDANTQGVAANKTTLGDHETRITQNEQDIDHLNTVVGGAVQHVNNLLTDNTKNKADIADLQSGKVDKADFTADQKR